MLNKPIVVMHFPKERPELQEAFRVLAKTDDWLNRFSAHDEDTGAPVIVQLESSFEG